MRTVYPTGTTIYKPSQCCNGYTILWAKEIAKLIDMNGRTVNEWKIDPGEHGNMLRRAKLLPDGHVLVVINSPTKGTEMMSETGSVQEYDWDSNLVWEYIPEGRIPHKNLLGPHHDAFRKSNGNTLVVCREAVPEEYMEKVREPRRRRMTQYGDAIIEVTPSGKVAWEWHGHEHLDLNLHSRVIKDPEGKTGGYSNAESDWMHVNTVQALPENKWFDEGYKEFKPDNVMISPRCMDTVYIIDRDTKDPVWNYSGDYMGGLSGQHEPYMIEKGVPGAGNVLIFDNGASPWKDLGHCGFSYVLEVNPVTKELVWKYERGQNFHSKYTSSAQRLQNGNTLICESAGKRIFEVTEAGGTVWEYVEGTARTYRYAYDYCPQTAALGKPKEVSVTPPKDLRVPPDGPLRY